MMLKLAILDERMPRNRKIFGAHPHTPLGGLQRPPDPQLKLLAPGASLPEARIARFARIKTAGSINFPYFDP